jgi:iron complex transport system ATP-binding protein
LENRPLPAYSARQIAQQLAYVPQENPMPFAFTVQEIVDLGTKTPASRTSAIEQMELEKFLHRSVVTLSGGERQRAAIARALAQETPLLLMDEPTTHLDIRHQLILLEVLKERVRCQGTTVLLVLHDLTFSAHHADYLFLLSEGELVAQGTPNDVLTIQTIAQVYRVETTIKIDQNNKKIDIFPLRSV